jgi:hypothetical protein
MLTHLSQVIKRFPPPLRKPVVAIGAIILFAWSHLVAIGVAMKNR